MRDSIKRSFGTHAAEKAAAEKAARIGQVAAICDAFARGGVGADRALAEIIDTARGDATSVVRVGEQHTPEVRT